MSFRKRTDSGPANASAGVKERGGCYLKIRKTDYGCRLDDHVWSPQDSAPLMALEKRLAEISNGGRP